MSIDYRTRRGWLALAGFLLVVIGVGAVIGANANPDDWYQALQKPAFNPPNWIFAPVWFTLYAMIAIAGWRVAMRDFSSTPMFLWILQMIFNWAWSPTWFNLHLLWPAFAIIIALLALILAFIIICWRNGDRPSALLFVPYGLWVAFASSLNLSIALLNPA
ncbi:MAG: TspO/MBR family protein [Devosia sp.]